MACHATGAVVVTSGIRSPPDEVLRWLFCFLFSGCVFMPQGTIKKIVADRGFGFITRDGGDIFFHFSAVVEATFEELQEGQAVEYEEGTGPKGPRAENVRPV